MFSLHAPAKINLFLHVGKPLPHGLHSLSSLNIFTAFGDTLFYKPLSQPHLPLRITGIHPHLVPPHKNFVLSLTHLLFPLHTHPHTHHPHTHHSHTHHSHTPRGHLHIKKQIPVGAGLGGGTSNAAAWIKILSSSHTLPPSFLLLSSSLVGSDFPSCFSAQPHTVSGTGNIISPLTPQISRHISSFSILIASPKKSLSTKKVFANFDRLSPSKIHTPPLPPLPQTKNKFLAFLQKKSHNHLTFTASRMAPVIRILIHQLQQLPHVRLARMSGSGSSCFALFDSHHDAIHALKILRAQPYIKHHVSLKTSRILASPPHLHTRKTF